MGGSASGTSGPARRRVVFTAVVVLLSPVILYLDLLAIAVLATAVGGPGLVGVTLDRVIGLGALASAVFVGIEAREHGRSGSGWAAWSLAVPAAPGYAGLLVWLVRRWRLGKESAARP